MIFGVFNTFFMHAKPSGAVRILHAFMTLVKCKIGACNVLWQLENHVRWRYLVHVKFIRDAKSFGAFNVPSTLTPLCVCKNSSWFHNHLVKSTEFIWKIVVYIKEAVSIKSSEAICVSFTGPSYACKICHGYKVGRNS